MKPRRISRAVIAWCAGLGALALIVGASNFFGLQIKQGASDACEHQPRPAGTVPSETTSGEFWFWPLGLRCSYDAGEGVAPITTTSDWWITILVYGGLVLITASLVLLLERTRRKLNGFEQ